MIKTSIIIPCFNAAQYLRETLESLKHQTVKTDIIAVDDGSTDETLSILKEYGKDITVIIQDHGGLGKAMNAGVSFSSTPYYIHLSADDLFRPNFIELAEKMIEEKKVDVVMPKYQVFGMENFIWDLPGFSEYIKENNTILFSSLTRRSLWEKLDGFEEHMPFSGIEDWEFWIRAYEAGATSCSLGEIGVDYRTHQANMTKTTAAPNMGVLSQWMRDHGRTR